MSDELRIKLSLNNPKKLKETYEYLYYKYRGLVAFIASKYLNDKDDIDDVINDTFLELFNNPNNIHSSIKGYLLSICKGKALKLLKEKNNYIEINDEFIVSSNIYLSVIDDLRTNLKDIEFEILYKHLILDETFKEIGKALKLNVNSVKTTYFRTLKKAKEILKD